MDVNEIEVFVKIQNNFFLGGGRGGGGGGSGWGVRVDVNEASTISLESFLYPKFHSAIVQPCLCQPQSVIPGRKPEDRLPRDEVNLYLHVT